METLTISGAELGDARRVLVVAALQHLDEIGDDPRQIGERLAAAIDTAQVLQTVRYPWSPPDAVVLTTWDLDVVRRAVSTVMESARTNLDDDESSADRAVCLADHEAAAALRRGVELMGAAIRIELHVTADASLVEALAAMLSASTRDAATPGRDDGYVTVKELAAILNVSERLIWSQVKTGAIQCIRIGRAVRIPRSSVNALLGEVSDG